MSAGDSRLLIAAAALACVGIGCTRERAPDAYGNVEATEVVVGSQATGQLITYAPAEGNQIPAGAVVATVDTTDVALQVSQAAAEQSANASRVTEVARQIGVLEAQRPIAERDYARTRRLAAAQAATAQQLDQSERDYKTLMAQIAATEAQQRTAARNAASSAARVAQLRDQLRKSHVLNPVGGTVLATYAKAGEFVQTGQPLYKIANLDTMELRAYVSEPQLAQIRLGQRVQVTVDAGGAKRPLGGTVDWMSSEAEFTPTPIESRDERTNLVYAIKIRLPNENGLLKIGMPADVELPPLTTAAR